MPPRFEPHMAQVPALGSDLNLPLLLSLLLSSTSVARRASRKLCGMCGNLSNAKNILRARASSTQQDAASRSVQIRRKVLRRIQTEPKSSRPTMSKQGKLKPSSPTDAGFKTNRGETVKRSFAKSLRPAAKARTHSCPTHVCTQRWPLYESCFNPPVPSFVR